MAHNLAYFATLAAIVAGVVAIFWFARHPGPKWARAPLGIGIVLFVGVFALLSFKLSWTGYDFFDFQRVYYQAGVAALHGDAATLSALTGNGVRGFVNIPIVAYLFAIARLVEFVAGDRRLYDRGGGADGGGLGAAGAVGRA